MTMQYTTLERAQLARRKLADAKAHERHWTITYITEALDAGRSWEAIGRALGVTGTAVRRYFHRNTEEAK